MLDSSPPCFRVSWIAWDSGFRGSGLRIADQIIAVDDTPVVRPPALEERQKIVPQSVGQYDEARHWAGAGARPGQKVTLTVRRRAPGTGWQRLQIAGTLQPKPNVRDANHQPLMSAQGPRQMDSDTFGETWSSWYDSTLVPKLIAILDDGWRSGTLVSQAELRELSEHQARVDFLTQHYPGPFAAAVAADFAAAIDVLRGARYDLGPEALKYRQDSDVRVQQIANVAQQAWAAMRQRLASTTIAAFPAIDPIRGDRQSVIGKYVVLPPIRNEAWVSEAGHNYLTSGDASQGWYIADAESPAAIRMLRAAARYRDMVSPHLDESYELIGLVMRDPRLLVMNGDKPIWGMQIEIIGALAGGQMFVDVSQQQNDQSLFAGESDLTARTARVPPGSSSPGAVIEAMVQAIKEDDRATWVALFADWQIDLVGGGGLLLRHGIDRGNDAIMNEMWDASRQSILGRVFDARVVWTDDPVQRFTGKEFPGAPVIDDTEVELEHIGQFDNEYRGFVDVTVCPLWRLQRYNGGPWRITSVQNL